MKSVLASIKPKYCELIANGKKRFEIRKTRPKIDTPFKCYMYCTSSDVHECLLLNEGGVQLICAINYKTAIPCGGYIGNGKVIGEFVCDDIQTFKVFENGAVQYWNRYNLEQSGLTYDEVAKYIGINNNGYAWHISDFVIYGEPNEIYEFYSACKNEAENDCSKCIDGGKQNCFALTRPPQSWCYVEELRGLNGFRTKSI